MSNDQATLELSLRRAQAFNTTISRYVYSLIETTKAKGAPDAATLIAACEAMLLGAYRAGEAIAPSAKRITCPRCGMTSYHPKDVETGYCAACHDWTGKPSAKRNLRPLYPGAKQHERDR